MESINYDMSTIQDKTYKVINRLFYTKKLTELLGKNVKAFIDRLIGYDHNGIIYSLNYGYIKK